MKFGDYVEIEQKRYGVLRACPYLPSKIAVISSQNAAGYQDFIHQLEHNPFGYTFYTRLFPAIVQGNDSPESIIQSLDQINNYTSFFDIVVLIRGGGSQTDLNSFNNAGS